MSYTIPKARIDSIESKTNALGTDKTDFVQTVALSNWVPGNGVWTLAHGGLFGTTGLRRTPGVSTEWVYFECPLTRRLAANHGVKPTGLLVKYGVSVAPPLDIQFLTYRAQLRAHGINTNAVLLGGDQDAHYDAAHDTAAERSDVGGPARYHTATITFPVGFQQAYLLEGERIEIEAVVTPDVAGLADITLLGFDLLYTGQYND